jgi:hypothetical protein
MSFEQEENTQQQQEGQDAPRFYYPYDDREFTSNVDRGLPLRFIWDTVNLSRYNLDYFRNIRLSTHQKLVSQTLGLAIALVSVPILTKNFMTGEAIRYRPVVNLAVTTTIATIAYGMKGGLLVERNRAQRGFEIASEIDVESTAENLVQQAAQRNYYPYREMGEGDAPSSKRSRHNTEIVEEDIARSLAENKTGVLIVAPTGCGKTSLVRSAMEYTRNLYQGVSFVVLDCKGEGGWNTNEDRDVLFTLTDNTANDAKTLLEGLGSELANKHNPPVFVVIDEWNNGLSSIANSSKVEKPQLARKQAMSIIRQIITKGRTQGMIPWITTHSPNTLLMGFDSAIRSSLDYIFLCSGSKVGLISQVLANKAYNVTHDKYLTSVLLQQFQTHLNSDAYKPNDVLALTNLGGRWRIVKVPKPLNIVPSPHHPLNKDEDSKPKYDPAFLLSIYRDYVDSGVAFSTYIRDHLGRPHTSYAGARYGEGKILLNEAIAYYESLMEKEGGVE